MTDETTGAAPEPETPLEPEASPEPATPLTLVYLDVDDEITSAAARIRGAGAERVALVLPFGSRLATSRINFRLLAREATERGKQIEIVCADSSARALAQAAGLTVWPSVAAFEGRSATSATGVAAAAGAAAVQAGAAPPDEAGTDATDEPEPAAANDDTLTRVLPIPRRSSARVPIVGPPRPPVRTGFAVGIGIAAIVVVLLGAFLGLELLPSATIVLHPRSEEIGPVELTVEARADVTAPDATSLAIPAAPIPFALEASQTFPATGVKKVETKATGKVRFSNFDNRGGVLIPAGTVVRTDDKIEFVTLAAITLPRAQYDPIPPFNLHPTTGTVGVEAVVVGDAGNVGNNTIVDIPKGGRNLFVTNPEPTSGGAITESPRVSATDIETATAAIEAALAAALDQQVAAGTGVPAGITLFPETRAVGEPEYAVDPESLVGTQAAEFDLAATAQGTAIGVDPSPIAGLAEARLRTQVTAGWTLVPDSIKPEIGTPAVVGEIITYPVSIEGTQVHDVDQAAILAAIQGLVLAQARSVLDDYGDVEITVWPDWVTEIPSRADRVTLELGEPQPSASPAP